MTVLFVDQLTVIDFSFFHPVRGIVGESWIMDVELEGSLDDNGMVFDFAHVKKQIKAEVDSLIDHKFLVPMSNSSVSSKYSGSNVTLTMQTQNGDRYTHESPEQAVVLIDNNEITIESVTPFLQQHLLSILPTNVRSLEITLRTEHIEGAYYHYSHGLKKHFGDCQRIAHGHRSKIRVFKNSERSHNLEEKIANEWQDIYLITREDIIEEFSQDNIDYVTLGYTANQGEFKLTLPVHKCDILETDSTVELIADFLADKLKQEYKNEDIKVRAFEGVQKGAIAFK